MTYINQQNMSKLKQKLHCIFLLLNKYKRTLDSPIYLHEKLLCSTGKENKLAREPMCIHYSAMF